MRTNIAASIQAVSGLLLLIIALDLGYMVWKICTGAPAFPDFQRERVSCLADSGLIINPTRWLIYDACISAGLGVGAFFVTWAVIQRKSWLRSAWIGLNVLAAIYFILFWALSAKNLSVVGWAFAGIYCFILFLYRFLLTETRRQDETI